MLSRAALGDLYSIIGLLDQQMLVLTIPRGMKTTQLNQTELHAVIAKTGSRSKRYGGAIRLFTRKLFLMQTTAYQVADGQGRKPEPIHLFLSANIPVPTSFCTFHSKPIRYRNCLNSDCYRLVAAVL